jgi:type IV secretory pathway TrbD component
MITSARGSPSRVISILMGCLAAIVGFVAFNVVDGIFGVPEALIGIALCIATTVSVFRRSSPRQADTDV